MKSRSKDQKIGQKKVVLTQYNTAQDGLSEKSNKKGKKSRSKNKTCAGFGHEIIKLATSEKKLPTQSS